LQKISVILIVLILTACTSTRKAANKSTEVLSIERIKEENLFNENFDIIRAEIKYTENKNSSELIGTISYRNESVFLVSLRTKAGIEAGRIYITKDTLLANDRFNKKLYYGSTIQFSKKYGIELEWIPVLFGDLIIKDEGKALTTECNDNEAKIVEKLNLTEISYTVNCTEEKVKMTEIKENSGKRIILKFDNFLETDGKKYPSDIEIIENEGKSQINIKIKKAEINTERKLKFIPGEGYEKIKIK
jgi:hypothetical protein